MKKSIKGVGKKVLASALSAAMVVTFTPVVAMADETMVNQESAPEITSGGTYKLTGDLSKSLVISADNPVVLDLDGHKLSNTEGYDTITVKLGSTLTIIDGSASKQGTVDCTTHAKAPIYNNGTVVLSAGKYTRSAEAANSTTSSSGGNSYYNILNHGSLTISSGVTVTSSGHFSSLVANGYFDYNGAKYTGERQQFVSGTN